MEQPKLPELTKEESEKVYNTQLRITSLEYVMRSKPFNDNTLKEANNVYEFFKDGVLPEKSNIHRLNN